MQSTSDCSLSPLANTLSVLPPTYTDTIQCQYYATLTREVCFNVGNKGYWCTQMWKQFHVTSTDYFRIYKIQLFWPHFIIQSVHYKTISTTCVVEPKVLHYLVHFWTFCSLRAGSGILLASCTVSKPVWHIPLLYVQWKTPDEGQNCPTHVEFYSKNKFDKLAHLVVFYCMNRQINRYSIHWLFFKY